MLFKQNLIPTIKTIIKKIIKADIVKVFSLTSVSTLIKMVTGFVSIKVVASIIGPAGVALLGQLNNFSSIILQLASGGINNGITKYVSEYRDSTDTVTRYLSTAIRITIFCSLLIGVLMIIMNTHLSKWIMMSNDYGYVFVVFGFTVILYALNSMMLSVINGFKDFKRYVTINIANSLVGLAFTLCFVFTLGLKGAMISAVTYQSVMFFITLYMVKKQPYIKWNYFKDKLSKPVIRQYLQYALMAFVTTACVPVSQLLLRSNVISQLSMEQAGWWEGMNRISHVYLLVITTSFSVYYLPRLSEIKEKWLLKREIQKSYAVILPMLIAGFALIYVLRDVIIQILFTPDFYPMEQLFIWQLLGDFFKISSWLLSFLMVAKAKTKLFIITEIVFAIIYLVLGFSLVSINGIVGLTQAYMINYILYTLTMLVAFRHILLAKKG